MNTRNLRMKKISFDTYDYINKIDVKPLSALDEVLYYIKKTFLFILIIIKRKSKRFKRTQRQVLSDYNNTLYKNFHEKKLWMNAKELSEFVNPAYIDGRNRKKNVGKFLVGSKLCQISEYHYYQFRQQILCEIINRFITQDDEIVELGCGYGLNLFSLRLGGIKNKMIGYDFSTYAIESAIEINQKFKTGIEFRIKDLTKELPLDLQNKTVFSYYAFEQLKYDTEKIIEKLTKLKPSRLST